jgi:methylthioribose-1-phosphate isomerase
VLLKDLIVLQNQSRTHPCERSDAPSSSFGLGISNQKNKNNKKKQEALDMLSGPQIDLHCLADPRPVASDLFMILSFLQVLANILQKYSEHHHQYSR